MAKSIKGFLGRLQKPPEPTPSAPAERLTLSNVLATIHRLGEEWPKRRKDLDAVESWLTKTQGQIHRVHDRLDRLKIWIDRYNTASEAAQGSIRLQGWLSVRSPRKEGENWPALAQEIYLHLSPIQISYGHCAMALKKGTDSFTAMEAELTHALGRFKTEIDNIEASLAILREVPEDAQCREAFKQVQHNATNMAKCSVQLCQDLYHAIGELVDELGKPIKEL